MKVKWDMDWNGNERKQKILNWRATVLSPVHFFSLFLSQCWLIFEVLFLVPLSIPPPPASYFSVIFLALSFHFVSFSIWWLAKKTEQATFHDEFSWLNWCWISSKNHKVNELKMFHDVYDDYILVKGHYYHRRLHVLKFKFKLLLHISHSPSFNWNQIEFQVFGLVIPGGFLVESKRQNDEIVIVFTTATFKLITETETLLNCFRLLLFRSQFSNWPNRIEVNFIHQIQMFGIADSAKSYFGEFENRIKWIS